MGSAAILAVQSGVEPGMSQAADSAAVAELPSVEHLRATAAEGASRGSRPSTSPTPAPTPTPVVTVTGTAAPTPTATGFPAVEGCDATIPDPDEVANGRLGDANLCAIGEGHELRPDAAAAFLALAVRYRDDTGDSLASCITDSYRSYDAQVRVKDEKPSLAAQPGTSDHGWGLAIDVGCGANSYGGALYEWLDDVGAEFGWINPDWAQPGGSKPEPWHWEFVPSLVG